MLTPKEFVIATPTEISDLGEIEEAVYRQLCEVGDLEPVPGGYGMLLAVEVDSGARFTLVTTDIEYVRALGEADAETMAGLVIPPEKFVQRVGWPDDWF